MISREKESQERFCDGRHGFNFASNRKNKFSAGIDWLFSSFEHTTHINYSLRKCRQELDFRVMVLEKKNRIRIGDQVRRSDLVFSHRFLDHTIGQDFDYREKNIPRKFWLRTEFWENKILNSELDLRFCIFFCRSFWRAIEWRLNSWLSVAEDANRIVIYIGAAQITSSTVTKPWTRHHMNVSGFHWTIPEANGITPVNL